MDYKTLRRRFCNIIFLHSDTFIAFLLQPTSIYYVWSHFLTAVSCFHIPVTVYFFFHGFMFRENLNRLFWKLQFSYLFKTSALALQLITSESVLKEVNAWSTLWLSRRRKNEFQGSLNNVNLPVSPPQQSVGVCLYLVHFPTFRHSTKQN